jgi:large subunit ribosomal protein L21
MSDAYAIIADGGKQYLIKKDDKVNLEFKDVEVGTSVTLTDVIFYSDGEKKQIGKPKLDMTVTAEVIKQARAKKIDIIKFKRRKQHLKRQGHRQYFTQVKILEIK